LTASLAVRVDAGSKVPPYEQLRAQLAAQIVDGDLATGTKLPTVRRLAEDLGFAVNTVARTYRELETVGLVETRGRAGTFVASGGDRRRAEVARAAGAYAEKAKKLGLTADEALAVVTAALRADRQPPDS
jgi:DNA-binding transcriptional regulator YhcF (GntR family)